MRSVLAGMVLVIWLLATNDPSSNGLCIQAQQKVHVLYLIRNIVNSVTKTILKTNNFKSKINQKQKSISASIDGFRTGLITNSNLT